MWLNFGHLLAPAKLSFSSRTEIRTRKSWNQASSFSPHSRLHNFLDIYWTSCNFGQFDLCSTMTAAWTRRSSIEASTFFAFVIRNLPFNELLLLVNHTLAHCVSLAHAGHATCIDSILLKLREAKAQQAINSRSPRTSRGTRNSIYISTIDLLFWGQQKSDQSCKLACLICNSQFECKWKSKWEGGKCWSDYERARAWSAIYNCCTNSWNPRLAKV